MDPDLPEVLGKHDRPGDAIAVALVIATFLGAFTVWLQAHALFEHDEAAVRAEEWTVLASTQRSRASLSEQLQLGRARQAQRDRLGSEQTAARRAFARGNPTLLALEAKQWRERTLRAERASRELARKGTVERREIEAGAAASFPDIDPSRGRTAPCEPRPRAPPVAAALAVGVGSDPGPPVPTDSQREAYRMEGLRDAAAETAVRAEEQFARYAFSLAAIAVALFLFGYALTKYGYRYRRIFALVAGVLTVASLGWSGYTLLNGPEKPPATAAAAYADGRVALDGGHFRVALADFACATRLNPGFASAYLQRSIALDQRGMSRDLAVVNVEFANPSDLQRALRYGRRTRQLDPEDPLALAQIAIALYVHGVRNHDRLELARALSLDRQMAAALPRDPIPAMNAATTLLAMGRPWRASYRRAERLMRGSSIPLSYVGGALTDLDYVGSSGLWPGIRAAAAAAKEQVVASVSGGAVTAFDGRAAAAAPRVTLRGLRLSIAPMSVRFSFSAKGFHPARAQLFAAWYRRQKRGWQELQQLSGPVVGLVRSGRGRYAGGAWSSATDSCLEGGEYKVELYVNGRLARTDPAPREVARLPRLTHSFLPDMDLGVCRPRRGWQRISHRSAGLVDGFERGGPLFPGDAPGRAGIAIFDISGSSARDAGQMAALVLRHFSPPLPGGVERSGLPHGVLPIGPLTVATTTSYVYPGGTMVIATATTPIGRKLAVAVFGPPAFLASPSRSTPAAGQSMLDSLLTYDVDPLPG